MAGLMEQRSMPITLLELGALARFIQPVLAKLTR